MKNDKQVKWRTRERFLFAVLTVKFPLLVLGCTTIKNVCGGTGKTASTVSARAIINVSAVEVTTANTHVTTQCTAHQANVTETVLRGLPGHLAEAV